MGVQEQPGVGERGGPGSRMLEAALGRAATARSSAAQCGDYVAAEHWHRRVLTLGAELAERDRDSEWSAHATVINYLDARVPPAAPVAPDPPSP
jgi:hypothetical protein